MSDSTTSSDVFGKGKYQVKYITVEETTTLPELFIISPLEKGTYPILLFCHGFLLKNTGYTTLLKFIASHGYIVIAPQSFGEDPISICKEVVEWLSTGLPHVLPVNVVGDVDNLALSGHSRGGKIAFALALDDKNCKTKDNCKFKAIVGIDPVAGVSVSLRPPPVILEYIPRCFDMSVPVAVIGTGLGNQPKELLPPLPPVPPFAPDGVNHSEFYNESKPPACYFLAKEYGHVDMMDDSVIELASLVCQSGKGSKDSMRRAVGGIVVAFLRCYLGKDEKDLNAIVDNPKIAPIVLDPVIYVKK